MASLAKQPNGSWTVQVKWPGGKRHSIRCGKLQKKELINEMPDDYNELKEFKRQAEQNKLESEGKYTEARQALEQQS